MHRDPTFEQAYINLERQRRDAAKLPLQIIKKRRRIKALVKKQINKGR